MMHGDVSRESSVCPIKFSERVNHERTDWQRLEYSIYLDIRDCEASFLSFVCLLCKD